MLTKDAIEHFGSPAALAHALGIAAPSIYSWGEKVPPLRQLQIQQITLGKLRAEDGVFATRRQSAAA